WDQIRRHSEGNPAHWISGANIAYIIYTSGTTGRPKGVLVQHNGICNLASAEISALGVRPNSHVFQFSSLSFDASVWEVFTTLVAGATLYLASRRELLPGSELLDFLSRHAISIVTLPPSVLRALPDCPLLALQTLVAAGEACTPEIVAQWATGRRFINAYGPTESTVCATWGLRTAGEDKSPIGRPLANTEIFLAGRHSERVPIGVEGELQIGGVCLARGYHGLPDLTADRFRPNSYGTAAGRRLYQTGDAVRYLAGGEVHYVGRIDNQVKVRGHRIELGEVESALRGHAEVREAVAVLQENSLGDKRLVAYVVLRQEEPETAELWPSAEIGVGEIQGKTISGKELREYLREILPEYMVPASYVVLDEMPLTANGKVDKRKLPAPEEVRVKEKLGKEEGVTPTEELMAGVWREVLGREEVGRVENFFELGGHSLLATRVVSRVREVFGVELELRKIFERPTVAGLAAAVDEERRAGGGLVLPPIGRAERDGELPLSHTEQRLWFLQQLEPGSAHYNNRITLGMNGRLNYASMEQSLGEIVRRQEGLRTT
ncbi:MAG: amino acid adenylation domain-containing protein, partial [Blastocatellia bacterium]